MSDNEIIQAAETCIKGGSCEECPYEGKNGGCRGLYRDLLKIIRGNDQ